MMEEKNYPGINFVPPPGLFPADAMEDECLMRWQKIDDKYRIVEIDGKTVNPSDEQKMDRASMEKEKRQRMSAMEEIDQIAQL